MKLEDVARLAGVSRTTASYIINGKAKQYRVSDQTIAKVLAIVKEYDYRPNPMAAGLRVGKTFSIGLIIPDLENISYAKIANYLEHFARQRGYQLLISCSEDQPEIEKQCVQHLKLRHVDALIISSSFVDYKLFYREWDNLDIPIFALDRALDPHHFRSIVGSDKEDAIVLAKALNQYAGGEVVYIGALPELSVSQLREQGFRLAWQNVPSKSSFIYTANYNRGDAKTIFSEWLDKNPLPPTLFVTSFSLLQGIIDAILAQKGRLPDELTIATFGDNDLLDFLPCNVISVAQQHQLIAETTLSLVMDILDKKHDYQPGLVTLHRKLVLRGKLGRQITQ